jgi:hypothetical protein
MVLPAASIATNFPIFALGFGPLRIVGAVQHRIAVGAIERFENLLALLFLTSAARRPERLPGRLESIALLAPSNS